MNRTSCDVAVIGGGPAGSVCAARLAARGRHVVVFEREKHPRFHLGESLLPGSLGALDAIGVLDDVRGRFMVKRGARFVDGANAAIAARYAFADAFSARWDHAFQVPRDEFDALLFRRAAACGADVRENWEVTRVLWKGERAAGVEARSSDGQMHDIDAAFVVDASGRDALVARAAGDVQHIAHLDRTALFTQVEGAWRDCGERAGDIQIVVLGDDADERGWFWLIPFADGRTSVGAVVSRAWVHRHPANGGAEALFDAAVGSSPTVLAMLEGARRCFAPRATADFSFRVGSPRGDGWLALGDASGFIDPLFSTGVHLAIHGALLGADAIDAGLAAGDLGRERFAAWEEEQRRGTSLFVGAVQAFYAGDLVRYLFVDPQHPFLRRAITSLLSGDVFDEKARWASDLRERFPARG